MDWLKTWNPVIDWRKQRIHLWVHGQWENVDGVLLDSKQHIGTVKTFDSYSWGDDTVPDISVVKTPQFWDVKTDQKQMKRVDVSKQGNCNTTANDTALKQGTVQKGKSMTSNGQYQIISSKRVVKLMKQVNQFHFCSF